MAGNESDAARNWFNNFDVAFIRLLSAAPRPLSPSALARLVATAVRWSAPSDSLCPVSVEVLTDKVIRHRLQIFAQGLSPDALFTIPNSSGKWDDYFPAYPFDMRMHAQYCFSSESEPHQKQTILVTGLCRGTPHDTPYKSKELDLGHLQIEFHSVRTENVFPLADVGQFVKGFHHENILGVLETSMREMSKIDGIIPQFWLFAAESISGRIHPKAFLFPETHFELWKKLGTSSKKKDKEYFEQVFGPPTGSEAFRVTSGFTSEELKTFWPAVLSGVETFFSAVDRSDCLGFYGLEEGPARMDRRYFSDGRTTTLCVIPYLVDDMVITALWTYLPDDDRLRRKRLLYSRELTNRVGEKVAEELFKDRIEGKSRGAPTAANFDRAIDGDAILSQLKRSNHPVAIRVLSDARKKLEARDELVSVAAAAVPHHLKTRYLDMATVASNLHNYSVKAEPKLQDKLRRDLALLEGVIRELGAGNDLLLKIGKNEPLNDEVLMVPVLNDLMNTYDWKGLDRICRPIDVPDSLAVSFDYTALRLVLEEQLRNALKTPAPVTKSSAKVKKPDIMLRIDVDSDGRRVRIVFITSSGEYKKILDSLESGKDKSLASLGLPSCRALLRLGGGELITSPNSDGMPGARIEVCLLSATRSGESRTI